jgi:hypothetical protein
MGAKSTYTDVNKRSKDEFECISIEQFVLRSDLCRYDEYSFEIDKKAWQLFMSGWYPVWILPRIGNKSTRRVRFLGRMVTTTLRFNHYSLTSYQTALFSGVWMAFH